MKTGNIGIKDKLYVAFWEIKTFFKPKRYTAKVFCIGFNKTGTSALGEALKEMGYDHSTFNRKVWRKFYRKGNIEAVLNYTAKFESFDDLPWLKEDMIPVLDQKFPGSKFIYLERDEESWKKSLVNWTKNVTGNLIDAEKGYENYINHQNFVLDYFKDKPEQFIRLRINDPEGKRKLGKFLGREVSENYFKKYNQS